MANPAADRRPQLPRPRGAARGRVHLRGHRPAAGAPAPDARGIRTASSECRRWSWSVGGDAAATADHTVPKPIVPLVDRPFLSYMIEWLAATASTRSCSPAASSPTPLRDALGEGGHGGPALRYRRGAGAARHRRRDQVRRGAPRRPLPRPQRRRPRRPRPRRRSSAPTSSAGAGDDRACIRSTIRRATGWCAATRGGEVAEFVEKPEEPDRRARTRSTPAPTSSSARCSTWFPRERPSRSSARSSPAWSARACGLRLEGYWMDIGTPSATCRRAGTSSRGTVRTAVGAPPPTRSSSTPARVAGLGGRRSRAPRQPPGCRIEAGADGPRVGPARGLRRWGGATVERSVLSPGASVEPGAVLRDTRDRRR